MLPLAAADLPKARKLLEWSVTEVEREAREKLAPAIDRVWRDEIADMTRDLKIWLERVAAEGEEWTPERFEFAFGLERKDEHDPASVPTPALVDGRFMLRGSIDLVERHRKTGFLRVTDHKTGKNRTRPGQTVVDGGVCCSLSSTVLPSRRCSRTRRCSRDACFSARQPAASHRMRSR